MTVTVHCILCDGDKFHSNSNYKFEIDTTVVGQFSNNDKEHRKVIEGIVAVVKATTFGTC